VREIYVLLLCLLVTGVASAGVLQTTVTDAVGVRLEHAVVSLHTDTPLLAKPGTQRVMDQKNRQFSPTVLPIQQGTAVSFPNTDDVRHHVYSFSRPNQFEIKLYHGEPSQPVLFDEPGIVALGCNIHDGMIGYLLVVDTPWYGKTEPNGETRIADVPAGTYTMQVWHPDMQLNYLRRQVNIGENGARLAVKLNTQSTPPVRRKKSSLQALFGDD